MIRFMVIGAPRSGTAWAANWLSTGRYHCIHDPLWDHHYGDLDSIEVPGKVLGIACTGLALWPDWINEHPARKIVLHRPPKEVNEAAMNIGYPPCPSGIFKGLARVRGMHVPWEMLFSATHARAIHEALLPFEPFDEVRHKMLCSLNVTSNVDARRQNPAVLNRIRAEGIPADLNGTSDQRSLEPATRPADAPGDHQGADSPRYDRGRQYGD